MTIRAAEPKDAEAIRLVQEAAFTTPAEARLVHALDDEGYVLVSLVAENEAGVVGHVLFSQLHFSTSAKAAALGPVAVLPEQQRKGIGSAMIRQGIAGCRALGVDVILVVGNPAYYGRFGFSPELGRKVTSAYLEFGEAWMAMELTPGAIPPQGATVVYPQPWSLDF